MEWRVFSSRFYLSRSIIIVRGDVRKRRLTDLSSACKWRSVCDFICYCPDATHETARIRSEHECARARSGSIGRCFSAASFPLAAILSRVRPRRPPYWRSTSPALAVSSPLFARSERLASLQDGSSALILSVPLFFSRAVSQRTLDTWSGKKCQLVFVSCACTHTRQCLM